MKLHPVFFISITLLLVLISAACNESETTDAGPQHVPEDVAVSQLSDEQEQFWKNIQELCGNAYEGTLADATPFYHSFDAERLVIHVRNCTDSLTHISLHLDDNHSRNLLLTKETGTLRLKHDHRNEDGTEEEITQYGGDAPKPGLEHRQIFMADEHTAEILPDRFDNFWFMDIMDEETFAYGVHWPKHGNSIRMEFDISEPADEIPPTPWGY
jgi:hypothetical protein